MRENKKSHSLLDPRSPLVLDTRELGRRPGSMKRVRRSVAAPANLGVELVGVPEGAAIDLDLRLESVSEGVLVSGTATAPVEGECSRCLDPFGTTAAVTLQELYVYPGKENLDPNQADGDDGVSALHGDLLDLEPALRDAVVLALPTNPQCREDCPGLCPECGVHWDELPPDHTHDQVDPRWAALRVAHQKSPDRATDSKEK